jgi:bifunctional non-homologous end joining protein LigD
MTLDKYMPMLCKTGKSMAAVANSDYILEEKLDGIRCIAYCTTSRHVLINRSGIDITERFPEVVLPKQWCVLDGELCCYGDDGYTDFQSIQHRMHRKANIQATAEQHPAVFVAFDCLEYVGLCLHDRLYTGRSNVTRIIVTDHMLHTIQRWPATLLTQEWLDALCASGAEGVIAKLVTSRYAPGFRSSHWLKFKGTHTGTYEVLGATYGEGKRTDVIGALVIGRTVDGITTYYGRVGTGFDDQELVKLTNILAHLADMRLTGYDIKELNGAKFAIMPETLYVKVKYQELTSHGVPRFPVYAGLCNDRGVLA